MTKQITEQKPSIGHWCAYCKDDILENEDYVIVGGTNIHYHKFCFLEESGYTDQDDIGDTADQNNLD